MMWFSAGLSVSISGELLILLLFPLCSFIICREKKRKGEHRLFGATTTTTGAATVEKGGEQTRSGESDEEHTKAQIKKNKAHRKREKHFATPGRKEVVKHSDPNYQTMAMLNDDVFTRKANDRGNTMSGRKLRNKNNTKTSQHGKITAPAVKRMIKHNDPNYQTLANLHSEIFIKNKKPNERIKNNNMQQSPKNKFKKPLENRAVQQQPDDPNYQTLAGISSAVFKHNRAQQRRERNNVMIIEDEAGESVSIGERSKENNLPKKPGQHMVIETQDPNYQTLANIVDVFKPRELTEDEMKPFMTY
ncbi:unnamed protein product [Auanema sp. JU1783]|nr:unnamed protein product [Auanema sp. JU1783]